MNRRAWIASGVALAAVLGAPWLAIPVVRSVVASKASARGVDVSIGSVQPVFGTLHLRQVRVVRRGFPGMRAVLDYVDVHPTLAAPHVRFEVHGGRIELSGARDAIRRELDALRGSGGGAPSSSATAPTPMIADGLVASFDDLPNGTHWAWGLRGERRGDGSETLGVDLARVSILDAHVEVQNGSAQFVRKDGARTVAGVTADAVHVDVALGGAPASKTAAPAPPDPGAAGRTLCARRTEALNLLSDLIPKGSEVSVGNVHFAIRSGAQTLNVGPATIMVGSAPDGAARVALRSSGAGAGTPVTLSVRMPPGNAETEVDFSGGPISLAVLGIQEGDMGLLDVAHSEVKTEGRARLAADCHATFWDGSAHLTSLSIQNPRLSPEALSGLDVTVNGSGEARLDGSRIALSALELTLGRARLRLNGALERAEGHARGAFRAEVPPTACADIAGSIPPALVPMLEGLQVEGTASLTGSLVFDTRRLADTKVEWNAENLCRLTAVPAAVSPARFRGVWERSVKDPNGIPISIESGPGTPAWVPYSDIPKAVTAAIVVCEDAHFFSHHGFDPKSISDSIRDDLRAGRFVRGGSTVTMQLAKNLYLGREKTLSRKIQEAALTLLLEQSFTKEELLELYFNVVEFAPGVYGIGPASEYYFDVPAKRLTPAQAFYLISLLPNPKHSHFAADGSLQPMWAAYLKRLMAIGNKIGRIDESALSAGLAEIDGIRFGVPGAAAGSSPESPSEEPPDQPQPADTEAPSGP